jgi:hypothetical protein
MYTKRSTPNILGRLCAARAVPALDLKKLHLACRPCRHWKMTAVQPSRRAFVDTCARMAAVIGISQTKSNMRPFHHDHSRDVDIVSISSCCKVRTTCAHQRGPGSTPKTRIFGLLGNFPSHPRPPRQETHGGGERVVVATAKRWQQQKAVMRKRRRVSGKVKASADMLMPGDSSCTLVSPVRKHFHQRQRGRGSLQQRSCCSSTVVGGGRTTFRVSCCAASGRLVQGILSLSTRAVPCRRKKDLNRRLHL